MTPPEIKSLPDHLGRVQNIWTSKYFKLTASDIWSEHLNWLWRLGWDDALKCFPNTTDLPILNHPDHEVVSMLQEFVIRTGLVNAHFGLTSSDIVDNVRLIQCQRSMDNVLDSIDEFVGRMVLKSSHDLTTSYTHLVPAGSISWSHRILSWTTPLVNLRNVPPTIHAKMFGGPTGEGNALDLLVGRKRFQHPFPWEDVFNLADPINLHPLQSSDHLVEIRVVDWLGHLAAQLHKVANDLRHLLAFEKILLTDPAEAGSSSMPHKINPFKWEKVCSICREVAVTRQEMWDVMAHNTLERTLDTSHQIKRLLPRAFLGVTEALDIMRRTDWVPTPGPFPEHRTKIFSDSILSDRVVNKGESRWLAYVDMINNR